MKKKIVIAAAAAAVAALLVVGGSLAWFTDADQATNTFTMNGLNLELKEHDAVNSNNEVNEMTFDDLKPGDTLAKDPFIKNVGETDALVRCTVTIAGTGTTYTGLGTSEKAAVDAKLAALLEDIDYNDTDFSKVGDYYYYNGNLTAGSHTPALFSEVQIPGSWGNDMAGIGFIIHVNMDGIQADNVYSGTPANVAADWTAALAD